MPRTVVVVPTYNEAENVARLVPVVLQHLPDAEVLIVDDDSPDGTGLLTQTASDTFTGRTIAGIANQITLSNGDGVAGNPTVSKVAALANTAEVANTPAGSGWTEDIDWSLGRSQKLDVSSATGNGTVTFSNPPATFHGIIKLVQGATPRTITWPAAKKWDDTDGEPTYAAKKTYLIGVYYDGTSYFLGASHPYT